MLQKMTMLMMRMIQRDPVPTYAQISLLGVAKDQSDHLTIVISAICLQHILTTS